MKKLILVVVCLFVVVNSFAQDAVGITHTLPATIAAGKSYDVDFTINKGSIGGFAKFQMDVPVGFTATTIDSKSGNFTFENQRIKIVWVSVPGDASFTFKFKLTVPANALNSCSVSAKFFYLENNVKKESEMPSFFMTIEGGSSLTSTSTPTVTSTPTITPTPTVTSTPTVTPTPTETVTPTTTYTTEPVATNTVVSTPTVNPTPVEPPVKTTPTATVSTTPKETAKTTSTNTNSTSGLTYKVQLGAFSSAPSKSKFPGLSIQVIEEGGFYKALSGNFSTMEQAQKHKADLAAKGYQGFVVTYQNGQRIGFQK